MILSVDNKSFGQRIIGIIKQIPYGKVMSYGQIAAIGGNPRGARAVAWLLHSSSKKEELPWHRVVNRKGKISLKGEGYLRQKMLLEAEAVHFDTDDTINFNQYLWPKDYSVNPP